MVAVLINPIDVWLKKIGFDIFGQPIHGLVDSNGKTRAQLAVFKLVGEGWVYTLKDEKSNCVFSADWQPPDSEMENALISFLEQFTERTLNLSYRGEWNENYT